MLTGMRTAAAVEAAAAARRQRLTDRIARGVRVCGRCRTEKPLAEFGPGPEADGHRSYCRECCAAWKREHGRREAADVAGAVDGISVRKKSKAQWIIPVPTEDAHSPVHSRDPRTRTAPSLVYEPDPEFEEFCAFCTAVWGPDGQLDHGRGCLMRMARPRR